jgi:hypothetical protein
VVIRNVSISNTSHQLMKPIGHCIAGLWHGLPGQLSTTPGQPKVIP